MKFAILKALLSTFTPGRRPNGDPPVEASPLPPPLGPNPLPPSQPDRLGQQFPMATPLMPQPPPPLARDVLPSDPARDGGGDDDF